MYAVHWRIQMRAQPARAPLTPNLFSYSCGFGPKNPPSYGANGPSLENPGSATAVHCNLFCWFHPHEDRCHSVHAPYGTEFCHFHTHFWLKVPTSEVHAPPTGPHPPWEILDLPLKMTMNSSNTGSQMESPGKNSHLDR